MSSASRPRSPPRSSAAAAASSSPKAPISAGSASYGLSRKLVLCRTVRDLAAALEPARPGDPFIIIQPNRPYVRDRDSRHRRRPDGRDLRNSAGRVSPTRPHQEGIHPAARRSPPDAYASTPPHAHASAAAKFSCTAGVFSPSRSRSRCSETAHRSSTTRIQLPRLVGSLLSVFR